MRKILGAGLKNCRTGIIFSEDLFLVLLQVFLDSDKQMIEEQNTITAILTRITTTQTPARKHRIPRGCVILARCQPI